MVAVRHIELPEQQLSQTFLVFSSHGANSDERALKTILVDHKPSLVGVAQNPDVIVKLIKPRKWHDRVKMLWRHSRLHKEVDGNYLLRNLGFRVPNILETGNGFSALIGRPFLGYYLMENLHRAGFAEAKPLFIDQQLNNQQLDDKQQADKRAVILQQIIAGLKTLRDQRVVFSDFHLDNVLVDADDNLAWIDTGVTYYQWYRGHKFKEKFNFSIERFIRYYSADFFTATEQQQLRELLL
ncbi:hypothetical protein [Bacterioplanoides sp. SCSIO 12839]|uniref:hypothetical protein n=1 Tax=Bacterioplanoides sp. SCSIO 12839 TaxID=2829569 RepID=UPI002103CFCA|nr:hypothetical protein [Bacterioplanoides sp. SCSIO 12839]UTW48610.1 hypothetical protein KFF03_01525 [Bacterioplanoides sp. SCSIO 12839]